MNVGTGIPPAGKRLVVEFEADIVLVGDEIPESLDELSIRQAVQNEIGHTGATVASVQGWNRA